MNTKLRDALDIALDLTEMLSSIRFDELSDDGCQGVHAVIARISEHLTEAKELVAQV